MPRVLLFGSLAEAAGARSAELDGRTVSDVLEDARARFDDRFSALLPTSSVWVNGEDARPDREVFDHDEIALLPPMSGG